MSVKGNANGPLVSIGLPVYNGENYLQTTLNALLEQSYNNIQIIVSDNGSDDKTQKICQRTLAKDKRVKYYRSEVNRGATHNFEKVLELSSGKYFMWCGHDDLYRPDFIKRCVSKLEEDGSVDFCSTSLCFIDESGEYIEPFQEGFDNPDLSYGDLPARLGRWWSRRGWYAIYSLYRLDVIKKVNIKNVYGGDVVLITDLLIRGHLGAKLDDCLFLYRQYSNKTEIDRHKASVIDAKPIKHLHLNLCISITESIVTAPLSDRQKVELINVLMTSWSRRLSNCVLATLWCFFKKGLHNNFAAFFKVAIKGAVEKIYHSLAIEKNLTLIMRAPINVKNILRYVYSLKRGQSKRCVVVEYNDFHDEVLPSVIFYLTSIGYQVDVITSYAVFKKNVFSTFDAADRPKFSWFYYEGWGISVWEELFKFAGYELIFLNSVEPEYILHKSYYKNTPVLAVMHNAKLLKKRSYEGFFASKSTLPLCLSLNAYNYVQIDLNYKKVDWISPTIFSRAANTQKKITFCVQGNIVFLRRNYLDLITSVSTLINEGASGFSVAIVGKNTGDCEVLKNRIRRLNICDYFVFYESELAYSNFYQKIQSSCFLLPLVDTTVSEYKPYFSYKVSSVMGLIFGFTIIPIMHRKLAEKYNMVEGGIVYDDGGLANSMKVALSLPEDIQNTKRDFLLRKKKDMEIASINNMRSSIKRLKNDVV